MTKKLATKVRRLKKKYPKTWIDHLTFDEKLEIVQDYIP